MLFMVTQVHTPDRCPIGEAGGSKVLRDDKAKGVKVRAVFGAYPQHTIWYVLEADTIGAVQDFLTPGFTRCTSTVTPISEEPMEKPARRR
ncbi:MAG: hypothetical protein HYX82_01550 [Chloroflexi bacterium]|nr:hypothetical protein [Chloroflexota bacterium]